MLQFALKLGFKVLLYKDRDDFWIPYGTWRDEGCSKGSYGMTGFLKSSGQELPLRNHAGRCPHSSSHFSHCSVRKADSERYIHFTVQKMRSQRKVKLGPTVLSIQLRAGVPSSPESATPIEDNWYYSQVLGDTECPAGQEENSGHIPGAKPRERD